MLILITNDDGIEAPGLAHLFQVASRFGTPWVVAPTREPIVQAHALTMHEPIRTHEVAERWVSVTGTPTDCVFLGIHSILPTPPGLVLSGINRGPNVSDDVHHSGTVAAAMDASLYGIPAIAVSLAVDWRTPAVAHWAAADRHLERLVPWAIAASPMRPVLNLNVPNRPADDVQELRVCRLARRRYRPLLMSHKDLIGRPYFWLGADNREFEPAADADGPLLQSGIATVTPLTLDITSHEQSVSLGTFLDEGSRLETDKMCLSGEPMSNEPAHGDR
jgi:5'-nucleotidase